jgi:hypothetical protein
MGAMGAPASGAAAPTAMPAPTSDAAGPTLAPGSTVEQGSGSSAGKRGY